MGEFRLQIVEEVFALLLKRAVSVPLTYFDFGEGNSVMISVLLWLVFSRGDNTVVVSSRFPK
jgi:hypothetical protein